VLGAGHRNTIAALNNLATLCLRQQRYVEADALLRRVLSATEDALGSEHLDTLTALSDLAGVYTIQQRQTRPGRC
jgi:hypothetical protein